VLKTPRTQRKKTGKNATAFIPVLNTFKITTFLYLEHKNIMAEYPLYNCISYRNGKTRQSMCSNYQVVRKDANCVANAEIKNTYLVLPRQKHN